MADSANPPLLGTVLLVAIALCASAAAVMVGAHLYVLARKWPEDFYGKLGELALQLAIVVIVGALVKVAIDWGAAHRDRHRERADTRAAFLKRVRAMHVTVRHARALMNAHDSARTWGEQSRRLMELRPEVEEIVADLEASPALFKDQGNIVESLALIVAYLAQAETEYIANHHAVDSDHKAGIPLADTLRQRSMAWVSDFVSEGKYYRAAYDDILTTSKGAMRQQVYGSRPASVPAPR